MLADGETNSEVAHFVSTSARRDFWWLCVATFFTFLTTSTASYLSVIFTSFGMDAASTGAILTSPVAVVTASSLVAARLISRFSSVSVIATGQLIILLSYLSFQITISDARLAALSYTMFILGFGLYFPAALIHAKGKLRGPRTAYYFGIFSCMFILPNVIGPSVTEWYFSNFGIQLLFPLLCVPLIFGMTLILVRRRRPSGAPRAVGTQVDAGPYLALLTRQTLLPAYVATFVVGFVWGFIPSFMALFLKQNAVPTALFFPAYTCTLLVSRFTILRWLSTLAPASVVSFGLACMGFALALLLLISRFPTATVAAATIFGFGYSMTFPVLSVWISDQFREDERTKPVTLFGAVFNFSTFLLPLCVGQLIEVAGMRPVLLMLVALAFGGALILVAGRRLAVTDPRL
ncbi:MULTISPECIES: MFS transporter [unclassified Bradyrhizobium]|uniref:MFS transporter n=1 Tax=unclassified Bradyrhizobium TaxID=2631580 RepID=UPI0028E4A8AB|nr:MULTISPECIES: MFS transporter [unclassified Bradyrhizobium]